MVMSDGLGTGAWHFRAELEREFQRIDAVLGKPGVVGELILDIAAGEPHQPGLHPIGIEKGIGYVEQTDDAFGRA